MQYKTVFVPVGGRGPAKYAQFLSGELAQLSDDGYEVIAITPFCQDGGGTLGLFITARKAE
jgi:hypothetical protein